VTDNVEDRRVGVPDLAPEYLGEARRDLEVAERFVSGQGAGGLPMPRLCERPRTDGGHIAKSTKLVRPRPAGTIISSRSRTSARCVVAKFCMKKLGRRDVYSIPDRRSFHSIHPPVRHERVLLGPEE